MIADPASTGRSPGFLRLAGCRTWTASLLPALVGTTLPFWLRPPGFSFRWLAALEFLAATLLVHAGFALLHARFTPPSPAGWPRSRLLGSAGTCLAAGCWLGWHLNGGLMLHAGVPGSIFAIYGSCCLLAGTLYVVPPLRFHGRAGGEAVVCVALVLLPVLGAYLVQVGDITRKVYLAAAPLVVATALWVWLDELLTRADDEKAGRRTMVMLFEPRVAARAGVPALVLLLYASLSLAVAVGALAPWALAAWLTAGLSAAILAASWREPNGSLARLNSARRKAFALHALMGTAMAASSLAALFA